MTRRVYLANSRSVKLFVEFGDQIAFGYLDEREAQSPVSSYLISLTSEQWKEIAELKRLFDTDPFALPQYAGYLKKRHAGQLELMGLENKDG